MLGAIVLSSQTLMMLLIEFGRIVWSASEVSVSPALLPGDIPFLPGSSGSLQQTTPIPMTRWLPADRLELDDGSEREPRCPGLRDVASPIVRSARELVAWRTA